jgi:hypothetical protein
MMSPEFLKQLQELRQARLRTQDFQKWNAANPTAPSGTGVWNAAPWTGQTAQAIVYDPATGKAYPNPAAALSAGVNNFSYQIPAGMNVDWSYWNQFAQPSPPPAPPAQPLSVTDQTVADPNSEVGSPQPAPQPTPESPSYQFSDEAKRFAAAGMMGRAKAAVEAAGGTWTKDMHRQLRDDAEGQQNYGGDFENQSTIDDLVQKYGFINPTSGQGGGISPGMSMGKAKRDYENKFGAGSWNKDVHVAIKASQQRAYNQSRTKK